jgi:hypothetical protein
MINFRFFVRATGLCLLFIQLKLQAQNNITSASLDFRLYNGALLGEEVGVLNGGVDEGIEAKITAVA